MRNLKGTRLGRIVPLAGVLFALLNVVGFALIGPNPESDVSTSRVTSFYSAHHAHIFVGGIVLAYASIAFVFFGVSVWTRIRTAPLHPVVAGTALVGTAVTTAGLLASASTYFMLGDIGGKKNISAGALQALHILGSELLLSLAAGVEIFLLAVTLAGFLGRVFPRWLSASALVIGVLQVTTIGFTAFLVFFLWTIAASITMFLRPGEAASIPARGGSTSSLGDPALTGS